MAARCEVACICGHEKAPAGHLTDAFSGLSDAFFRLADMAILGVALITPRPCRSEAASRPATGAEMLRCA